MQKEQLDTYLKDLQSYTVRLCDNAAMQTELLKFIEGQAKLDKNEQLFFKGEAAFYQSKYSAALKYYLACVNVNPYSHFFVIALRLIFI